MPTPDPMQSPVTTFLYVLMRDHLPTGTVKFLIEQAQRAGDPIYSAPELEKLAERYASQLLSASPRDASELDEDEAQLPSASSLPAGLKSSDGDRGRASPPPPKSERPTPKVNTGPGTGDGKASQAVVDEFMGLLLDCGGRLRPSDFDELGKSNATRARVIRELRADRKVYVEYEGQQRYVNLIPEDCTCTYAPLEGRGGDTRWGNGAHCLVHLLDSKDANEVSGAGQAGQPHSSSNGAGTEPANESSAVGESPASTSESSVGGRGQAREEDGAPLARNEPAKATPGGASEEDELVNRVGNFIDKAEGEVWPHELEVALGITSSKRLLAINALLEDGRVLVIAPNSPQVRYRSGKTPRPSTGVSRPRPSEAATPLSPSHSHLTRDPAKAHREEAKQEQKESDAAMERLPAIRQWVRGTSTFSARQLREIFELSPATCTRIIAELVNEDIISCDGEVFSPVRSKNGNIGAKSPSGKRPLNVTESSLEGRALSIMSGQALSLAELASRLAISEEVARAVVGRLFKDGEVRPRSKQGTLHYTASA